MANPKVNWNGTTTDGGFVSLTWSTASFTFEEVLVVKEVSEILGSTHSRRKREEQLRKLDKRKKKKLIHLICRIKGEKVYDEQKEIEEVDIKLEDAELVVEKVLGRIKVETKNVL